MNAAHLGLLTVDQCAELLQCSVSQIERFIKAGELRRVPLSMREVGKGQRGPKGWRVSPTALREFIEARDKYEPQVATSPTPSLPGSKVTLLPIATGTDGKQRLRQPRPK